MRTIRMRTIRRRTIRRRTIRTRSICTRTIRMRTIRSRREGRSGGLSAEWMGVGELDGAAANEEERASCVEVRF